MQEGRREGGKQKALGCCDGSRRTWPRSTGPQHPAAVGGGATGMGQLAELRNKSWDKIS